MSFVEKKFEIEGEVFVCKISTPVNSERVIAVLPAGGFNVDPKALAQSDIFKSQKLQDLLETSTVVIFDYPGISKAPPAAHVKIEELAFRYVKILEKLELRNIIIFGISFGGSVVNEMIDLKPELFSKAIIAASGEYFYFIRKTILSFFDLVVLTFPKTKVIIKNILVKILHIYSDFDLNGVDSLFIMGRSVIRYKVGNIKQSLPTLLIFLDKEKTVTEESMEKMKQKYTNHKLLYISARHTKLLNKAELEDIKKVFFEQIVPFLNS